MRIVLLFFVLLGPGLFGRSAVQAQPTPLKGIVWQQPESITQAEEDLRQMRRMGVQAVRTGLIRDVRLLTLADTLGLQLFQELPVERLPAPGLRDTIRYAQRMLAAALSRAHVHPSARYFGLARRSDTSDSLACAYFSAVADYVRERAPEGTRVYYVTSFVEQDRCADVVDLVLLDARGDAAPLRMLERWRQAHAGLPADRVGIGAVGTWVAGTGRRGLLNAHSPEAQARYLEDRLNLLLAPPATGPGAASAGSLRALPADTSAADTSAVAPASPPYAVFVYRWRDEAAAVPSISHDLSQPYQRTYGLYAEDHPRPAFRVVEGLFGGQQAVFAFPGGEEPEGELPWRILLGWGIFALLGLFYALSPRLRFMMPRYFTAHSFFREAVREGRDVLLGSSTMLLVAIGITVGLLASLFLEEARTREAFEILFEWLPGALQEALIALLVKPWLLALLLGCLYMIALVVWSALLSIASRRRYRLAPAQALMLVVWPRWSMLLLLLAIMVASTLPSGTALEMTLYLLAAWLLISSYAVLRTLFDYASVTRVPAYVTLGLWIANPLVFVVAILLLVVALEYQAEARYLWHLFQRA